MAKMPKDPSKLTTLTADQAKALGDLKESLLNLSGLKVLSIEAAAELVRHKASVCLDGLTTLSDELAEELATHMGVLFLNGLVDLSDEAARALARHRGALRLNGLTTLSDEAAGALASHIGGSLGLDGLKALSDDASQSLSNHKGGISLGGLEILSPHTARTLAKRKQPIELDRVTILSEEAASALATHRGLLSLNGLAALSVGVAKALAAHEGELSLSGLKTLSDDGATALAKYKGTLVLNGIETLSAKGAAALATHDGDLYLDGLQTLSDDVAMALATSRGPLSLSGLTSLSAAAAKTLTTRDTIKIPKAIARIATKKTLPRHTSSLAKAAAAGATTLRSVWHGFGDDGSFKHLFLAHGKPLDVAIDPEQDVQRIVADNDLTINGNMNGSVGVLTVDLTSGQAVFRHSDFANEYERFAEFLNECEWAAASTVTATVVITYEAIAGRRIAGFDLKKLSTTPPRSAEAARASLFTLIDRLLRMESDDDLLASIMAQCGDTFTVSVDLASRTFVFAGGGKKVTAQVPADALETTSFTVPL